MSKVLVEESSLSGIAQAIRQKNGTNTTYKPGQMAAAIAAIPTGITPTGTVNITQNGTTDVTQYASAAVNVSGGGGALYTNTLVYPQSEQITDVTGFTAVYDTSVAYGSNGTKVATRLAVTDESAISTLQYRGWNAPGMAYYDSENKIGACGGYNFGEAIAVSYAKFWLGRYSGQNKDLIATIEYLDSNGNWNEVTDVVVAQSLSYPFNVFTVQIQRQAYGVRWIHKKGDNKSSGNNIIFAGMSAYRGTGTQIAAYIPTATGLVYPPTGYDGFGPLLIV